MHDYTAYRLRIRSDVPLPELVPAAFDTPDISIAAGVVRRLCPTWGARVVEYEEDAVYFALGGFASFRIRDGSHVEYELPAGMDPAPLNFAILGPLMALLMQMRGLYVLHGSAVSVGGRAAMFLGDKGAGKSTTLGATLAAGHPMLTDDVLAVATEGVPAVIPGYPQIKLDPAAAARFPLPPHRVLHIDVPGFEKHRVRFEEASFAAHPAPAGAVYVLERGATAAARRLDPAASLGALLRFSYIVRFGEAALAGPRAARHFAQAAAIANTVPVYALEVPDDVARIREVLPLIGDHHAAAAA